jgi:hypothetical protein
LTHRFAADAFFHAVYSLMPSAGCIEFTDSPAGRCALTIASHPPAFSVLSVIVATNVASTFLAIVFLLQ